MTTENEESPVRHFCTQLDGYIRAAGHSRSYVVTRHPMSDSQVYAVLAGTVKTPPAFDRMIVPIVEICGGDAAEIAQWRTRHDTMVRVYELQKSLRRKAASEPGAAEVPVGFDVPAGYNRFDRIEPLPAKRPRWPLPAAIVAVIGVVAAGLTWALIAGRPDAGPAATDRAIPQPAEAPRNSGVQDSGGGLPVCTAGAPAPGGDLLDVPRPAIDGDPRYDAWWANDQRVKLERRDEHSWTATAPASPGQLRWTMLVIRGCLPVTAEHHYRLRFTASGDTDVRLGVRVQENQSPWPESFITEFPVTAQPREFTFDFTGERTSQSSELTFQLAGNPAVRLDLRDITLTDLGA